MEKNQNRYIGIFMKKALLFLLLSAMLLSCTADKSVKGEKKVIVKVETVSGGETTSANSYVGTVAANSGTVLSFQTGGNVTRLNVREGDHVRRGQLLGTVSPTTLRDSHYATEVTLRQARDAYSRMKKLHDEGVVSEIKWVEVETKLQQAEAAERIAREQLSHTSLYAPFDGVITSREAEIGMNVLPDQPVYKLAKITNVDVNFSVPEAEISHIAAGNRAQVRVDALDGRAYEAVVAEKGVVADAVSHTYNVRLALNNADGKLLPGMVCSVNLRSASSPSALVIPMRCVELDTDNTRFVWVVEGGKARRRNIVIGDFAGNGVTVVSGLVAGDRLIVEGAHKVSGGMAVEIKK